MKINKALNLVVPVYEDDEKTIRCYVHSTPIARETFDKYFMPIAQTFSAIYNQGLGEAAGPRVAMRLLRHISENTKTWEDDPKIGYVGVKSGLVEEMRRLTVVVAKREGGWQPVPLQVAVDQKLLDEEDAAEVENAIAFFIVSSAMHRRAERRAMLESAAGLWGALISSSGSSDFAASLSKSTGTAGSGAKASAPAAAPSKAPVATADVDGKPSSLAF